MPAGPPGSAPVPTTGKTTDIPSHDRKITPGFSGRRKMTMDLPDRPYFFDEGIRFECTRCGACCTGAAGQVLVSELEVEAMAATMGQEIPAFREAFLRKLPDGVSLREKTNGDCVFYSAGSCTMHRVKPGQCRSYPFWVKNLRNESAWEQTRRSCEGIGRGRLHTKNEILELLAEDLERDLET
jgi:Fe-S-cluster containining protein